jgi:hypothetical protein
MQLCKYLDLAKYIPGTATLLTSRRNGLVTLYDVSQSASSPLRLRGNPYSLSGAFSSAPNAGTTLVHIPIMESHHMASLYQISKLGSINRVDIGVCSETNLAVEQTTHLVKWSPELKNLEERIGRLQEPGMFYEREHITVDMHEAASG